MIYSIDELNAVREEFRKAPVSFLHRVMSDPSESLVRREAAVDEIAFCKLPPMERSRMLLELVDDADEQIQTLAITLLGELPECGGVKERLRCVAARAVGQLRFVALRSLAQLGDCTVLDICREMLLKGPDASVEAVILLGFLRNDASQALLTELLNSTASGKLKEFTARALAKHGSRLAIPTLEEALCRGDRPTRALNASLLITLGRRSGWAELLRLIEETPDSEMASLIGVVQKITRTTIPTIPDKAAARTWIEEQLRKPEKGDPEMGAGEGA